MEWSEGEKKRLGSISSSFHGAEHTMSYIDSQIASLPTKLANLRSHGYPFFGDLEENLQTRLPHPVNRFLCANGAALVRPSIL